jgi:hypothetical protein
MAKRTNNDLQNTTLKTKDGVTRTPLKQVDELRCSGLQYKSHYKGMDYGQGVILVC